METATDFSQNIKKQLTNTLYVVSVDGNTNVLYMNAITGECNLVFDTRIAIDNVMLKYHNTIENDDMAILEFEYLRNGHKEVLLRNGEKVSEDMDNVSMFYSITDISENLFSYDRGDEMNIIDRFGRNKLERYPNDWRKVEYLSEVYDEKYIIVEWLFLDGNQYSNILDIKANKIIMHINADCVYPCKKKTSDGEMRFIQIHDDECWIIDTKDDIISAQISCKYNCTEHILIDTTNHNESVPIDCLEDYLDDLTQKAKFNDRTTHFISLINEKGMPKQVIICSENAVRAYSEIKKLEIKDKKLFIENCLCEFNNDEQVHFIY